VQTISNQEESLDPSKMALKHVFMIDIRSWCAVRRPAVGKLCSLQRWRSEPASPTLPLAWHSKKLIYKASIMCRASNLCAATLLMSEILIKVSCQFQEVWCMMHSKINLQVLMILLKDLIEGTDLVG
jgi:hypothetical protein